MMQYMKEPFRSLLLVIRLVSSETSVVLIAMEISLTASWRHILSCGSTVSVKIRTTLDDRILWNALAWFQLYHVIKLFLMIVLCRTYIVSHRICNKDTLSCLIVNGNFIRDLAHLFPPRSFCRWLPRINGNQCLEYSTE